MKICIISTGRAGSTSLYELLRAHLPSNYYFGLEPFNTMSRPIGYDINQKPIIESKKHVLIKTLVDQTQSDININDMHVWLFEHFDEIILLDRLDKQLQIESFSYQTYTNSFRWHDKRRYRMELVPNEIIQLNTKRVEYSTNKINELSKKYNKKIYYYEDIFLDNNHKILDEIFSSINRIPNEKLLNLWVISNEKRVRLKDEELKIL
jgi:hypothetical protein